MPFPYDVWRSFYLWKLIIFCAHSHKLRYMLCLWKAFQKSWHCNCLCWELYSFFHLIIFLSMGICIYFFLLVHLSQYVATLRELLEQLAKERNPDGLPRFVCFILFQLVNLKKITCCYKISRLLVSITMWLFFIKSLPPVRLIGISIKFKRMLPRHFTLPVT